MIEINQGDIKRIIWPRSAESAKWDYGNLLILAGTGGMGGSAILCAKAALRSGCGLVRVATSRENFTPLLAALPEAIPKEAGEAIKDLTHYDGIAMGPGMGRGAEAVELLTAVLEGTSLPLVIDGDGLNILAEDSDLINLLRSRQGTTIITPHVLEAARLLRLASLDGMSREEVCNRLAERTGAVVLLKGHNTVIRDLDGEFYLNTRGNPGMATAGSGDVLTGVIGSLVVQGSEEKDATCMGAYIHGRAGDLAAEEKGQQGLIAGDIVDKIPLAFKEVEGKILG